MPRRRCRFASYYTTGRSDCILSKTSITVNRWLPGSIELFTEEFLKEPKDLPPGEIADVTDSISLPGDIPAGVLDLSLAVVDESSSHPVVRLGITGRTSDGWYPLSKVRVAK